MATKKRNLTNNIWNIKKNKEQEIISNYKCYTALDGAINEEFVINNQRFKSYIINPYSEISNIEIVNEIIENNCTSNQKNMIVVRENKDLNILIKLYNGKNYTIQTLSKLGLDIIKDYLNQQHGLQQVNVNIQEDRVENLIRLYYNKQYKNDSRSWYRLNDIVIQNFVNIIKKIKMYRTDIEDDEELDKMISGYGNYIRRNKSEYKNYRKIIRNIFKDMLNDFNNPKKYRGGKSGKYISIDFLDMIFMPVSCDLTISSAIQKVMADTLIIYDTNLNYTLYQQFVNKLLPYSKNIIFIREATREEIRHIDNNIGW